ncbi:hypothetical protein [Streptomyces harbinensis]|uniref:hypothetical protein n=1 Tax=Streptomyces harbinensis TaxID=1176198 RepID=UPI0036978C32
MAQVIDYGGFAERLRRARERAQADSGQRWALLGEVQREWGYTDPGGDPVWRPGDGENTDDGVDPSLPVPAALGEWWESPVNSFAYRPRLYWVHTQWPRRSRRTAGCACSSPSTSTATSGATR